MFDTVAISKDFLRLSKSDLKSRGALEKINLNTGELENYFLNGERGSKEPRITISPNEYKGGWILKAEVSISSWLKGSNVYLPDENDLQIYFSNLSEYVEHKSGIVFNAHLGRVSRADMTKDFLLGENEVLAILSKLKNISIPKYDRQTFNDTGVYFYNKGKWIEKRIGVYSKFHEVLKENGNKLELECARGVLRLEIQHLNNPAVSYIAKSLRYPNHNAKYILTPETSEIVISKIMKQLHLTQLIENPNNQINALFKQYDLLKTIKLTGHLYLKDKYGPDYYKHLNIAGSERKIKEYEKQCLELGISSLE